MRVFLIPYNDRVSATREIRREVDKTLDCWRAFSNARNYRSSKDHVIINWGNSDLDWIGTNFRAMANSPVAVTKAISKLRFFEECRLRNPNIPIPKYTTDTREAQKWLNKGKRVVARSQLAGRAGHGITLVEPGGVLPQVLLYTKYEPKSHEYRVHVFNGEVIDVQQKKRRKEGPKAQGVQARIRSYDNGWVFVRQGVQAPAAVLEAAKQSVAVCGLTFGAVDVGWSIQKEKATVYEVNTAPGIEGTTIINYSRAIIKYVTENFGAD